jgi:hypothetical protein
MHCEAIIVSTKRVLFSNPETALNQDRSAARIKQEQSIATNPYIFEAYHSTTCIRHGLLRETLCGDLGNFGSRPDYYWKVGIAAVTPISAAARWSYA